VVTVGGINSNGLAFTLYPIIASISPSTAAPETKVSIAGKNFGSNTGTVTFNGLNASIYSWSDSAVVAIVPTGATSGNIVVSDGALASNGVAFTAGPVVYADERTITIDHTKVANSDQVNFPILVSGVYSYLATTANGGKVQNSNGYDIELSENADGSNKLDHEIESYDPATGAINLWVRIPLLSHVADTVIYLHYGSAAVITSQENKAGVWDSNYQMVLHLGEAAAPYHDSTSNGYLSSGGTYPSQAQGKIGQSQFFNSASSQYISFAPTQSPSPSGDITMETWIKTNEVPPFQVGILGKGSNDVNGVDSYELLFSDNGVTSAEGSLTAISGTAVQVSGTTAINDNVWHHIVVAAPSTGNTAIYVDGVQNAVLNNTHPLLATITDHFLVGGAAKASDSQFSITGSLDEVRISNSARSADWIATEYNNQNAPSVFYSAGSENAPAVVNVTPFSAEPQAHITIAGNGFTGVTGTVSINGHAANVLSWSDSSIVAVVPNGITTGPLVVTAGGVQANPVGFTVLLPVISSVGPNASDIGSTVVISGANFDPAPGGGGVTIGGGPAQIVSWSPGSISVRVPDGAISGNVLVSAPYGEISNAVPFIVTDTFAIEFFSPSTGPIGTEVTILGGGFGATQGNSDVEFDGVSATITHWSDTQIRALVPQTGTGPINIALDAGGSATTESPFVVGNSVQIIDSLGNVTSYSSSMLGGAWYPSFMQGSGCSSCTFRGALDQQFDMLGNTVSNTDELGRTTSYTYDADDNVLSETKYLDANTPVQTNYTYNSFGEPKTVTDPLGNKIYNEYDANGNLTSVTTPKPDANTSASVTHFGYDPKGQLTLITDPLGHHTTIAYYPTGLINTISDDQGNTTTYEYDLRGNRTRVIDALQNSTKFDYDIGNRLTQITYQDQTYVSFGYDLRGRRTSVTDQNHKTTTYGYDDADRLTDVYDPAQNHTSYSYDTESNLLSITDAASHTTSFTYDAFGRVKQTTFPAGPDSIETFQYDAVGNLTSKTDRKGQTIQYVYDALDRLSHKGYPDSTDVDYVYDLVGKIKQVSDPTGTYGFAYDNMGRLLGTTTQYSFLPGNTYTNAYSYDAASNRTSFTAPDSSTNTYAYDTLNRLSTLTNSLTGQFGFGYDILSHRIALNRPNGVNTTYGYDSLSRLQNVLHKAGATTVDGAGYTYDSAGNRISKTNYLNNITEQYGYDPTYQLTQVTQGTTTTESYSYDAVGNRLSSLGMSPYTYNSSNELTSMPSATFTYDDNGNVLNKIDSSGTTTYNWDFENRLASVVLPSTGGMVTFKYDPFGRRVQKSSASATTNYLYDGANSIEETGATGTLLARSTQGLGIDEPIAESRGGTIGYYLQDGLGSVTSINGDSGSQLGSDVYNAFGVLTTSTGSFGNSLQYTGRDTDPETGLHYYRARYYSSDTGRFLNEDPRRFFSDSNFYRYARNNNPNLTDAFGLTGSHPANLDGAWNQARMLLSDPDCSKFLKGVLTTLHELPNLDIFLQRFDNVNFGFTPKNDPYPDKNGSIAHVDSITLSSSNNFVHVNPRVPLPSNCCVVGVTLLHEVLHTFPYAFRDFEIATAVGYKGAFSNGMKPASLYFSQVMEDNCVKACKK
jgi:RHS repeat-associated protein